jgi:integrase/recombinase XerD
VASLYRKPIVSKDPITGEKVKTQSKKWWGQYKDANGRLRRCPLAIDKKAALAMLNKIVLRVEREKAGLIDPTQAERERPIAKHLEDFERSRKNRGVGERQVKELSTQLKKIVDACAWRTIADISSHSLLDYVGKLIRPVSPDEKARSPQTYNHYLRAAKQFSRWLVRDGRNVNDPLSHLSKINVAIDRRHDRRPLAHEEFTHLLAAARKGAPIEGMAGEDRAMLYLLAGYTGFRKGELGSLTRASLQLTGTSPTVTVAANYSKRRRRDTQLLHPDVASALTTWFARRSDANANDVLFPISRRAGAIERKTGKMMKRDLAAARKAWIQSADDSGERERRETSEFLAYRSADGRFADFHSLRHFFITNLERAGVSPKVAQTLARHSDIRLTLGVYTHVGIEDQSAAIGALRGMGEQG